jgi:uncharacterized protein YecT (DUF1311 family)
MKCIPDLAPHVALAAAFFFGIAGTSGAQIRDVNGIYRQNGVPGGIELGIDAVPTNNGEKITISAGRSEINAYRTDDRAPYVFRDRDCIIQFKPEVLPRHRKMTVENNGLCADKNADFGRLTGIFIRPTEKWVDLRSDAVAQSDNSGQGPSFVCRRSAIPTEQTICNVAELAALDREMAALYGEAMAGSGAAQAIRSAQRNWIGTRNHCGVNVDCLRESFRQRIAEFKAATAAPAPAQEERRDSRRLPVDPRFWPPFAGAPNSGPPAAAPVAPAEQRADRNFAQPVPPAAETSMVATLAGEWEGRATCNKIARDVLLKVRAGSSGDIEATFESYTADALFRVVPHADFIGRKEGDENNFRFVPLPGSGGTGFDAKLADSGGALSISLGTCEPYVIRQVTPRFLSRRPTAPPPAGGGSYRPGDSLEARCQALLEWAGRISKEYPDLPMRSTIMSQLFPKGALLFSDDDFVPVFGFTYDAAATVETATLPPPRQQRVLTISPAAGPAAQTLRAAWNDIRFECARDPFIRDKGGWVWAHSLFDKMRIEPAQYYGGDFAVAAINNTVRSIRVIRNELRTRDIAAEGHRPFSERAKDLIEIRTKLAGQAELLWPSELAGAKATVTRSLNDMAAIEGDRVLAEIAKTTDSKAGTQLIKAASDTSATSFMANMDDARKAEFRQRLETRQTDYDLQIARPYLERAQNVQVSLDGARQVAGLIGESGAALAQMGEKNRKQLSAQLETRRDDIVKKLIADDLTKLRSFPPDASGLKSGAAWILEFNARYKEFPSAAGVGEARAAFVKDRAARLVSAIPDAEAALGKIQGRNSSAKDQAKKVLADFLGWEGDSRLPESLEYDAVAAKLGFSDL